MRSCRLYLITPPRIVLPDFLEALKEALDGGDVAALQLRLKESPEEDIRRAGEAMLPLCRARKVEFLVNDSPTLARAIGADGVHIGEEEDGTVTEARALLGPDKIIGVSCYASKHRAMEAGEQGADYVAFGAFHPTTTKTPKGRPAPDILEFWSAYTTVPCVAIGGINAQNAAPLVRAGADFLAVVSAVWTHASGPGKAVAELNKAMREAQP